MTHRIVDYPLPDEPSFYMKFYQKKEFYDKRYKEQWWNNWTDLDMPFKNLPHQDLVYSVYGPHTPYMSGFLLHGCGSGKSNCGTQIIEGNKLFLDEHSSMALLLVPNELIMSSIVYDLLGKEVLPDGTIRFEKKGTGDKYIDSELRKKLNEINNHQHTSECDANCDKQQQQKIRKIVNYIKKEKLLQYYDIETHQRFAKVVDGMNDEEVSRLLSNRVIIVDEIHKIRNQTSLYKSLRRVVVLTHNTKFLFMTGTACVDRENEIQPIINLLRENDGYEKKDLLSDKDIRTLFHKDVHTRANAELQFAKKIKGYVSFIRGMNPITFPIRVEMGTRFFQDVNFNTIDCFMKGKQLAKYLNVFFDEFNPNIEANSTNELWEKTRCASRCAFENTTDKDWLFENVWNISCKFSVMWEMFKYSEGDGAILIYAFNVEKGINLVEKFLKLNGIERFTLENATKKVPKYVNFSNVTSSEERQRALDIAKSHENYKGEYLKFILGTGKIRTGITFKHLSQAHVVETDWNIPTTEQTIFRGARQFSHHHPIYAETNKKIMTFRYRSIVSPENIAELPEGLRIKYEKTVQRYRTQLKKRGFLCEIQTVTTPKTGESNKKRKVEMQERLLSIDDFMYRSCLSKDIPGNRVERLCKVYAYDNPLQIRANFFPNVENETFEGSRIANYDKLEYDSPIPNEEKLTKVSNIQPLTEEELDRSTFELVDWVTLVNDTGHTINYIQPDVVDSIVNMFCQRTAWKFFELKAIFRAAFPNVTASDKIIAFVMNWLVDTQYKFSVDKVEGYVIYANDVYVWVPLNRIVQTSMCDLIDISTIEDDEDIPNNFETRYFSIHPHIEYDNAFEDVFGDVELLDDLNTLFVPDSVNIQLYDMTSSLCITLKDKDILCGVIDNTKDNPNKFNMKLWKGKQRIAASSKKLSELKKICQSLDINTKKTTRKGNVCDALQEKLIQTKLMLPWAPGRMPSLYRLYMVAKLWKKNTVCSLIEKIVKDITSQNGELFVDVVIGVVSLRRKNIVKDFPNIRDTLGQYFMKKSADVKYVLALLERMYGARPTRLNDAEWNIMTKLHDQKFYQVYKTQIANVYKEMNNHIDTNHTPIKKTKLK